MTTPAIGDEVPEALRTALSGRYDMTRLLGRGGMASVFLAEDRKHHRQVALKVLRPDLAASLGADRFLKEIDIAASLTHPHILPLHDSGEASGFLYYVMPYIDGGSLRTRLLAEGPMSVMTALMITGWVAAALSYAHRMGVLHRDIKPENILFNEGHPIVADFGIAKAISTAGGQNLTRTGFPLGTPGYMSPEQAAGLTDLDASTDVYSLACVCYEMLVGQTPGRWPTEEAVRAGRFVDAPPSHRKVLDALPPAIEPALARALAIRLDQRTATPQSLAEELRGERTADARPAETEAPRPKRRYSDGEVEEIVKRAAELEVSQPTMSGAMTIGTIQEVAAQAGIDPAMVRKAAARLNTPTPLPADPLRSLGSRVAGGPTRITVERLVQGEVAEADCAYLIEEVRTMTNYTGIVGTLGKSVTWVASQRMVGSGVGRDIQVSITMRGGQTRIAVRENLAPLIGAIFGGIGGGVGGGGLGPIMGILAGALHIPVAAAVIAPCWVLTVLAGARAVYHSSSTRRVRELEDLGDRMASLAAQLIAEAKVPNRLRAES